MGELHLDILVDRLLREFKVKANIGRPQVAYRETIEKRVIQEGKFERQSGDKGQFGHVWLQIEPLTDAKQRFEFNVNLKDNVLPAEMVEAVRIGVEETMDRGGFLGYPLEHIKVTLFDGSYREEDASESAYKIAAFIALTEGIRCAQPVLLEPIMDLEVTVPDDFMGEVLGHLSAKRGKIENVLSEAGIKIIKATVPLAEMFGYTTDLRSMSQGRAFFTMEFKQFDKLPPGADTAHISGNSGNY
jgi:elongation factor G